MPGIRIANSSAGDEQQGGDAVDEPGDGVDQEQEPGGAYAGEPGRLRVVAHGIDVTAGGGLTEHEPGHGEQDQHQYRAVGDIGLPNREGVAEERHRRRQLRDGLVPGVDVG